MTVLQQAKHLGKLLMNLGELHIKSLEISI